MTKKQRKSKRTGNRRGKARGRGNNVQRVGQVVSYSPHIRCLYPAMPREFSVALRFRYFDKRVSHSSPSSFVFGLFEFLNQRPMFSTELFNMYRLCRITAVHVRAEMVNTGSDPVTCAMATLPWSAATSSFDPNLLAERPRAVVKIAGLSTGMSRVVLNRTYFSFDELGNPVYDKSHYFDSVQSIATTPQDQEAPAIVVSVNSTDPTVSWSALTTYTVTYHTQWFEPQWADYSTPGKTMNQAKDQRLHDKVMSEKEGTEPSWEDPLDASRVSKSTAKGKCTQAKQTLKKTIPHRR